MKHCGRDSPTEFTEKIRERLAEEVEIFEGGERANVREDTQSQKHLASSLITARSYEARRQKINRRDYKDERKEFPVQQRVEIVADRENEKYTHSRRNRSPRKKEPVGEEDYGQEDHVLACKKHLENYSRKL